jgi:hypothetical protein
MTPTVNCALAELAASGAAASTDVTPTSTPKNLFVAE